MAGFDRKRFWTSVGATAAVALLPVLGCQSVENSTPSQTEVRVIDASYNAPAVDVKVGTTLIASNIGAATFHQLRVSAAGRHDRLCLSDGHQ